MTNLSIDTELWLAIVNDIEASSLVNEGSYIVYEVLNTHQDRVVRSGIVKAVKDNIVTITRPYTSQKTSMVFHENEQSSNVSPHDLELSTNSLHSMEQHLQRVEIARESISKILDSHISDIAVDSSSQKIVCAVFQAVIDIMSIPMGDNSWRSVQNVLQQGGFIQRMTSFDACNLSQQERADVIQRLHNSEILKRESISEAPQMIMPLLEWIWAQIELLKFLRCKEDYWDQVSMFSCRSHWSDFTTDTHEGSSCQSKGADSHFLNSGSYIEETLLRSAILNVYSCEPPDNDPATILSGKIWRPELMKCLQRRLVEILTTHTLFEKDLISCNASGIPQLGILSEKPAKLKHDTNELEDKLIAHNSENYILAENESKGISFSRIEDLAKEIEPIRVFYDKNESLLKSHFYFVFQDDEYMSQMNNIPEKSQRAFACEVAQCCGVPLEHVVDIVFTVGALRVDFNVVHSAVVSTDTLCAGLHAHRQSILRLFGASFGGTPSKSVEAKEYACQLQAGITHPNTVTQIESLPEDSTVCEGDTFLTQRKGFKGGIDKFLATGALLGHKDVVEVVKPFDAAECVRNELPTISDYHLDEAETLLKKTADPENTIGTKKGSTLTAFADYQLRSTSLTNENKQLRERISAQAEIIAELRDNIDRLTNELHEVKNKLEGVHKSISAESINSLSKQEAFGFLIVDDTVKTHSLQAEQLHPSLDSSAQSGIQKKDVDHMAKDFSSAKKSFSVSADSEVGSQILFQQQMDFQNSSKSSKSLKVPNDGVQNFIKKISSVNSSQREEMFQENEDTLQQVLASTSMDNIKKVHYLSHKPEALKEPFYEDAQISALHSVGEVRSSAAPQGSQKAGTLLATNDEALTFCLDHSISPSNPSLRFNGRSCEASCSKVECKMCAQLKQNVLQYKHYCHRIEWCYTESKKLNDMLLEQVSLLRTFRE